MNERDRAGTSAAAVSIDFRSPLQGEARCNPSPGLKPWAMIYNRFAVNPPLPEGALHDRNIPKLHRSNTPILQYSNTPLLHHSSSSEPRRAPPIDSLNSLNSLNSSKTPIDNRFIYTGERRQYVAFPLGGIGTGSVSLTGSGRLIDWSIRNRPAIHQFNGYSHFAIKAEQYGKLLGARVLNGPYEGIPTGSPSLRKFDGFGFGANRDSLAGVPHFDDVTFIGQFPVAEL